MTNETKKFYEAIGETFLEIIKNEMAAVEGIYKGSLTNSNLYNDITYQILENPSGIQFNIPDYAIYVEAGRKAFSKKVPIAALIRWMKRKNIALGNKNSVAYAIQQSIYKNGIKPRPFIKNSLEALNFIPIDKELETLIDNELKRIFVK